MSQIDSVRHLPRKPASLHRGSVMLAPVWCLRGSSEQRLELQVGEPEGRWIRRGTRGTTNSGGGHGRQGHNLPLKQLAQHFTKRFCENAR